MSFVLHEALQHELVSSIRRNDINAVTTVMGDLPYTEVKRLVTDHNILGQPIIFHACQARAMRIVEYLVVECGADVDIVAIIDGESLTPMLFAIKMQCTELLLTLIALQADLNMKDPKNRNLLVFACLNDNHEAAKILCDNKVDINSDMNVFHCGGNKNYLEMALKFGTDIKYTDSAGNTILMLAALNGELEVISKLVNRNINIYCRNCNGANALDLANLKERKIVIHSLLNRFYSRDDYIQSLEFCGAYVLLFLKSKESCVSFWNESLIQRRTFRDQIIPKLNFGPTEFPLNTREFDIDTGLDDRKLKDLLINAILVFYRILSPQSSVTKKAFYLVVLSRCPDVDIKTRFSLLKHVMHLNNSCAQGKREILYSWQVLINLTSKYLRLIKNTGPTIEEISELYTEFAETLRNYVKPFFKSNTELLLLFVEKYKCLQIMGLKYLQYFVDEITNVDFRSFAILLTKSLCEDDSDTSMNVLHLAISNKMTCGVVELLIECGSDINAVDEKGNTPLDLIMQRPLCDPHREKIVQAFVRDECNQNANNSNGVLRENSGSL